MGALRRRQFSRSVAAIQAKNRQILEIKPNQANDATSIGYFSSILLPFRRMKFELCCGSLSAT